MRLFYHNPNYHALLISNLHLKSPCRQVLDVCDECPNSKYAKVIIVPNEPDSNIVHYNYVELKGHSLICHVGSDCKS